MIQWLTAAGTLAVARFCWKSWDNNKNWTELSVLWFYIHVLICQTVMIMIKKTDVLFLLYFINISVSDQQPIFYVAY